MKQDRSRQSQASSTPKSTPKDVGPKSPAPQSDTIAVMARVDEARKRFREAIVAVEENRVPPRISDWPARGLEPIPENETPTEVAAWISRLAFESARLS